MPTETRSEHHLPEELRSLFWEHEFDRLSWTEDRDLIFRKVLADGPWPAVQWLRQQGGDDAIRSWIEEHRGRGLDKKQLRFWQLILELPAERVDGWLLERAGNPWERRCEGAAG